MTRVQRFFCLALLTTLAGTHAGAASLSLMPGAVTVAPGGSFTLDLVVSGLGDAAAPSLSLFDIDVGFDPFDLSLIGVTLGSGLGDVGLGEALDASFGEYLPGVVNVAEVSFLSTGELDGAQPDTFVLATLEFAATSLLPGESTAIDILAVLSLGDSLGDPIAVDAVAGAVITAVPIPAALWLLVSAVGGLGFLRTRARATATAPRL